MKYFVALAGLALFAGAGYAQNADNGKKLFVKDGCYECHGYVGQGGAAGARLAPNPRPVAYIITYVRHPAGQMPPYTAKVISDAELGDIRAYLATVPAPPPVKDIPLLNQ